jgi:hypothetical protein
LSTNFIQYTKWWHFSAKSQLSKFQNSQSNQTVIQKNIKGNFSNPYFYLSAWSLGLLTLKVMGGGQLQ